MPAQKLSTLDLLNSGKFQIYNRAVAKALGSVNAAIMLSELINRYQYHEEEGELKTFKKHEGIWFFYTVEKCESRTVLSDKEQMKAIKTLEKFSLFKRQLIGIPARRHFRLDLEGIASFITGSNNVSRSAKREELDTPKGSNKKRPKSGTIKEHNEEPKERSPFYKNNEESVIPPKKRRIENPRDFLKTKEEKAFFDRLSKYKPVIGSNANSKAISFWIAKFGIEATKKALLVYEQQCEKSMTDKKVDTPKVFGAYMRNALNKKIEPEDESFKANKKFAEKKAQEHDFIKPMAKYVKVGGCKEFGYSLPHPTFTLALEYEIENQVYEG